MMHSKREKPGRDRTLSIEPLESRELLTIADGLAAPDNFVVKGQPYVFTDFTDVQTEITFNADTQKTSGYARVEFEVTETGYPVFDLVPNATSISLNGESLDLKLLRTTRDPDRASKFKVLKTEVEQGTTAVLEVEYEFRRRTKIHSAVGLGNFKYKKGEVSAAFVMDDIGSKRGFWENYGVSNFEYDAFEHTVDIIVLNTESEHQLFANGDVTPDGTNHWSVAFPETYTSSSFFLQLSPVDSFVVRNAVFAGVDADIPVMVYGEDAAQVDEGAIEALRAMEELEGKYGAYMHDDVLIYLHSARNGYAMEYSGATVTEFFAIEHELNHFWFGRGVLPANGNSGWIDEAIVTWGEEGHATAEELRTKRSKNLLGKSPYVRKTDLKAYTDGALLMSEFDLMLQDQGGLLPFLKQFYEEYQGTVITNEIFEQFLIRETGVDLSPRFDQYVYGIKP